MPDNIRQITEELQRLPLSGVVHLQADYVRQLLNHIARLEDSKARG